MERVGANQASHTKEKVMDKGKNNNGNNHWKVSAAEFRGHMRGTLEGIETAIKDQKKDMRTVKNDIVKIKEYIAGRKAVQNIKSAVFGIIGGTFSVLVGFILYKLFG